jgi:hypothetical protein
MVSMAAIEVLPRRFIEVWQKSEYVSDVAQKLRLSKGARRMRAWRYKNHCGVPLKVLPTTRPAPVIDWDEMAELAASLLPNDEARRLAGWNDSDDEDVTETPEPETGIATEADTMTAPEGPSGASDGTKD